MMFVLFELLQPMLELIQLFAQRLLLALEDLVLLAERRLSGALSGQRLKYVKYSTIAKQVIAS